MRIGIVTRRVGFNDGQGRVNYEIASEALRQGHEVTFFCEHVQPSIASAPGVRLELTPAPNWLPSRLLKDQVFAWRNRRRIGRRTARNAGCDAVLSNGFATWAGADVNAVHFVHSSWRHSPHHPWRLRRGLRSLYGHLYSIANASLERSAFRRSGRIVAVSEKVRQELVQFGVPAPAIETIINGVDATEFCPGEASRMAFGLPDHAVIGLFAGDLRNSRKNLDTVLKALVHVPGLHLAVAGRHDGTPWPALAATLGVAERVHFLGFQKDMPAVMRASDLFVFPSRYEACSLVLLEALASGLPVITASSAGGAELITDDVGVVLSDSEDVPALAAALTRLAADPALRRDMGEAGRRQALRHSWPAMAQRYIGLLEAAARQRQHA